MCVRCWRGLLLESCGIQREVMVVVLNQGNKDAAFKVQKSVSDLVVWMGLWIALNDTKQGCGCVLLMKILTKSF